MASAADESASSGSESGAEGIGTLPNKPNIAIEASAEASQVTNDESESIKPIDVAETTVVETPPLLLAMLKLPKLPKWFMERISQLRNMNRE
ncbi:uncharacterized protein SPPG_08945 [Spizellomyces punctatus DAOM BR117]|uniref:Uncharacterized protein n=1 Tax=Spizellomyces punctatus (strain DAOM BR117) TaxID=645134 RepID=A0A0L0HSM8_SPIPD|nr:uncharacterized protein SPPG_08945 [Spizellomyces punctatus DAOM BR117]KND04108.1 hypothetical protein SPPG_08945 [Spizellomyces punctatus DAOM BR117]|eukprot:XP_016612147.1 hypothetical protein SPPG_08945 [Spizellomyces punctatus DAOM BR117]